MTEPRPLANRAFWPLLAGLGALAWLARGIALRADLGSNPFGRAPLMDADVYWRWAGAIARGELVGETPFLSAPLYPYLLGVLRALGADLPGVGMVQVALYVASGLLLGLVGRRAFGAGTGLLAAALFFGLSDPAYYTGRILNVSAVVFLAAATLLATESMTRRASVSRAALVGLLVGLLCLAHPPMLATLPLFALWAAWQADGPRWRLAASALATSLATIAPATLHNLEVSGEFIPISAQAGITFFHGNQHGSDGTYSVAQGVSTDRRQQNLDALQSARAATGDGSWKAASRHFFALGLETWEAAPAAAAALCLRKAYWFLSGRTYGDIYLPALEREDGLPVPSRWAPLPLALLTWPGLTALFLLLVRDPRRHLPLALLGATPLLVVCVFWYSPRYRLPAAPALVLGAAWALVELGRWRERPRSALAIAAAFALATAGLVLNPRLGFDAPDRYRPQYDFTVGTLHMNRNELAAARVRFVRARAAGHAPSAVVLGDLLRREGDVAGAIEELQRAVELLPEDAYARRSLGTALAQAGRNPEARTQLEHALTLDPNHWEAVSNLGNVLRALGDVDGAIERYERAIALNPDFGDARYNLAVTLTRDVSPPRREEALEQLREALRRDPAHAAYRALLGRLEERP